MSSPETTTEIYDKEEILECIQDVEARLAGIRFILEHAEFEQVEVVTEELALAADGARRVSRRRGC